MDYFAEPFWLWMLLPAIGIAFWLHGRRIRHGIRFAPLHRLPTTRTWRHRVANITPFLYLTGLCLAILAMAGPRSTLTSEHQEAEAIAIYMVIDVSGTMNALDMAPEDQEVTRLDIVKQAFADFVESRPHDLIGLISFASYPVTRIPLTLDHAILAHGLSTIETPTAPEEQMTAIGDALLLAVARLEDAEPVSRIAVLLSDGVHNFGDVTPDFAAEIAHSKGVRVYTIGVGESGLAEYRLPMPEGRFRRGQTWIDFDGAELEAIADATDGVYYHINDADGLARALTAIDSLETTRIEHLVVHHDRIEAHRFIVSSVLLIVVGIVLNTALLGRCI